MRRLLTLCLVLAFIAGCATKNASTTAPGSEGTAGAESEGEIKDIGSFRLSDPEGPKVVDQELESIPTEVNPLVEKWITYFKGVVVLIWKDI